MLNENSPTVLMKRILRRVKRTLRFAPKQADSKSAVQPKKPTWEPTTLVPNSSTGLRLTHFAAFTPQGSNAGDILLPATLRDSIVTTSGPIRWKSNQVRDQVTAKTVDAINESDGLIIGGGGLFLCDTNRNDQSGWQWPCPTDLLRRINAPLCLMAVGYNRFRGQEDFNAAFRENLRVLAEKSVFIGLRNHGSIEAIREYLPTGLHRKIRFHPCLTTVISKLYPWMFPAPKREEFIALNCAFDRPNLRFGNKKNEILSSIAAGVDKVAQKLSLRVKYYSHYAADEEMISVLNDLGVDFDVVDLSKLETSEIIEAYKKPLLVCGMRGHAQMIPFGCRTPILSLISHNKLQWFLDDIQRPDWGIDLHAPMIESRLINTAMTLLGMVDHIERDIAAIQSDFWKICSTNIAEFIQHVPEQQATQNQKSRPPKSLRVVPE